MLIKSGIFGKGGLSVCLSAALVVAFLPSPSFSQLALGRNKWVGNVIHTGYSIRSDFATYWDQVTPENDGKWGSVESSPGVYNWAPLDNDYNYAIRNGFPFKEHNLIWGSEQPSFMTDGSLDSAQEYQEIANWIDSCGHRYPLAAFCDVVNEPINTPPSYKNALGGNGSTGWDWVVNAFKLARRYWSPTTRLLINEYNVLGNSSLTNEYIAIIDTLKVRGLIDGIGIQGHYFEFKSPAGATQAYSYPISTLKSNLDKIASATGLPIYISEFAINEATDSIQLQNYQTYFPLFYTDPAVKGMTLWGYTYGQTWEQNAYLVRSDGTERPALQWLRTYLAKYLLMPAVIFPVDTTGTPRNPPVLWHSSIAASSYRLQLGTDDLFSTVVIDSTVSDTLLQLPVLNADTKYYWHVAALNASDTGGFSVPASFTTGASIATDVRKLEGMPAEFELRQNYPNPFNPTTVISYQLSAASDVTLSVFDILGREVATLVNGKQTAGYYDVTFDASNLPSGVYFYRLQAGSYNETMKLMLLK